MKKFLGITLASLFMLSMTSCLKDKGYDDHLTGHDLSDVPQIIEIAFANEVTHQKTIGLDYVDEPVNVTTVYVRLAAGKPATEDITVTLDSTGGLAKIQAAGGDSVLNANYYTSSEPDYKVTIPKG